MVAPARTELWHGPHFNSQHVVRQMLQNLQIEVTLIDIQMRTFCWTLV